MPRIHPFQALRPTPARAREFSCERLDHLPPERWIELAERVPRSVAGLMHGEGAAAVLEACRESRSMIEEPGLAMYMHRQVKGGRRVAGVVALLEAEALANGSVLPMRESCPDRGRAWRTAQAGAGAQLDPVIVGVRMTEAIQDLLEREMNDRPLFHVLADDGATHTLWRGCRANELAEAFRDVGGYLLEGHARARHVAADGTLMAMLVPLDAMAPNWSVVVLEGDIGNRAAAWLAAQGSPVEQPGEPPAGWVDACVDDGRWFRCPLPPPRRAASAIEMTDLGRARALVAMMAGPDAVRGIRLVPGDGQAGSVQRMATRGAALMLARPSIAELGALADQGVLLPAGSTWFEPRIRSGLWLRRTTMPK